MLSGVIMTINDIRAKFPITNSDKLYLNHAAKSPIQHSY